MLGFIAGSGWHTRVLADPRFSKANASEEEALELKESQLFWLSMGVNRTPFLLRHGPEHQLAPHQIDYRRNIKALRQLGVDRVFSCNLVGSMAAAIRPGELAVPVDVIDYTWGRATQLTDEEFGIDSYTHFGVPFCPELCADIAGAADQCGYPLHRDAVYACTQGPRLETAAEIKRLKRDGCSVVGMTLMPEAVLAREAGLAYASLCSVVNYASGIAAEEGGDPLLSHKGLMEQIRECIGQTQQSTLAIAKTLLSR